MPMIDADTHVDECEDTWKKLEGTPYAKYIPVTVSMPPDEAKRAGYNATTSRCWVVEGRLQNRAIRDEVNHPPRLLRELQDVPGRVPLILGDHHWEVVRDRRPVRHPPVGPHAHVWLVFADHCPGRQD